MIAQLSYTHKTRGYYQEQSADASQLAKKLETLRCPAELWSLDEKGQRVEKIGACEENDNRTDDRRIKWLWWYDKQEVGL